MSLRPNATGMSREGGARRADADAAAGNAGRHGQRDRPRRRLQQRFSYRVEAVPDAGDPKKRVLVIAAEDYTGSSPNRGGAYDVGPRYLQQHVDALTAAGYEVETFNATPRRSRPPGSRRRATRRSSGCSRTSTRSSGTRVTTSSRRTRRRPTRGTCRRATQQSGSQRLASWAHKTMIAMRDYLNEGGKAIVAGRNIHQWPTGGTGLSTTGPYDWAPDKLPGFFYPEDNGGDDDLPGTAFQRYRDISNDTWQNYLGVVGRGTGSGYGATHVQRPGDLPHHGEHLQRHDSRSRRTPARATTRTRTPTASPRRGRSPRRGCATGPASRPRSRCARRRSSST